MRRLAVLALLTPSLLLPFAGAARAAAPSSGDALLVVRDGVAYLGNADLSSTSATAYSVTPANAALSDFRASADGTRFTYVLRQPTGADFTSTTRIVVRDASARQVRTLDGQTGYVAADDVRGSFLETPSLTPDGNQAVWTIRTRGIPSLRRGLIATPGLGVSGVPNSKGLESPVALNNNLTMMALKDGTLVSLTPIGTRRVVTGLPAGSINSFSVSPDGSKVAYEHTSSGSRQLSIATLTPGTYPSYSAGPSTLLVDHYLPSAPAFSHDGTALYWSQGGDILTMPVTGGTPTNLTKDGTTPDESAVVGIHLEDTPAAPGSVTNLTATLGAAPALHWTLPADTDLSGVSLTRTAEGQSVARYVPAPLTSYQDLTLPFDPKKTWTYTLTTVDRSGHTSISSTQLTLQTRLANMVISSPTSQASSTAPFPVHMPVGTYNLSVRTNGTGPFVRIATGGTGSFVFGSDYGTTSKAGDSYTFRVQVFDDYGNGTPVTLQAPASVPFDDASFTYTGATQLITTAQAFLGKEHVLLDGSSVTFTGPRSNLITVMGALCGTCGSVDMYVNGRRVALAHTHIDMPAGYHYDRRQLMRFATVNFGLGPYTVKLVARGGKAIIDGIAFRR